MVSKHPGGGGGWGVMDHGHNTPLPPGTWSPHPLPHWTWSQHIPSLLECILVKQNFTNVKHSLIELIINCHFYYCVLELIRMFCKWGIYLKFKRLVCKQPSQFTKFILSFYVISYSAQFCIVNNEWSQLHRLIRGVDVVAPFGQDLFAGLTDWLVEVTPGSSRHIYRLDKLTSRDNFKSIQVCAINWNMDIKDI